MGSLSVPISIHTTPRRPTDADVTQHRSIRLEALRTNPDSFLSTYEHESQFNHAEWRNKMEQDGVWTFYAKYDETPIPPTSPKLWLATMRLLSPSFLTRFLASPGNAPITTNTVPSPNPSWPLSLLGPETDIWLIVGLWVRPQWRRKKVAQEIVQEAIHFVVASGHSDGAKTVETSASDTDYSLPGISKTTYILLEAYAHNIGAIEFYRRVGFEIFSNPNVVEVEEPEPDTYWMRYTVPPMPPMPPMPAHRSNL